MDNRSAQQVIAAIERLSNRIAKLDETGVESAAIANEARRAAMDAAEATSPGQIAAYVEKAVSPTLNHVASETRDVHRKILNESWRATHDANELRKTFESERSSLGWQQRKLEELRYRYWFSAVCGGAIGAVVINIVYTWLS